MATRIDLLITSLQESVRLLQRYMVTGLGAAAFFALLVATGTKEVHLQAPAVGSSLPVSTSLAIAISLAVYWSAGAMASVLVERARRLVRVMHGEDAELLSAALSYPAVPTLPSHGPRVFLTLAPAVLVVYATVGFWGVRIAALWPIFGLLLLILPYVVLTYELRKPLGGKYSSQWEG